MVVLLTGCGNVKEQKFTKDNQAEIMEKVRKSREVTVEEAGLLVGAMTRMARQGQSLEGRTVGELIEEQRSFAPKMDAKEKETSMKTKEPTGHVDSTGETLLKEYDAMKSSTRPSVIPSPVMTHP